MGGQFYLMFGELVPPLETDVQTAIKERRLSNELPIRVVARVALPAESMLQAAAAINQNVETFKQKLMQGASDDAGKIR